MEKLKVYQTTDNYTPYWTFVNLVNYIFQDIEKEMFYYPISDGETPQVETKHLTIKIDFRRAMYLSIDEDYLKYGHLKNDNEFKSSYHLHVEEMIDYLTMSMEIPKFHTSYNPKDDYRLTIFAISDNIKVRVFNDEIIDSNALFFLNGVPLIEDLNRLAKDRLNSIGSETLTDFLNYHFLKYNGKIEKFIKNLIELTNDSWKDDTATNILKRQTFTTWKQETKKKYNLKESDFEENIDSENQNLKVFDNMELYPLIDLKKTKQLPFWVYNNYAYVYYSYLESFKKDPQYYVMGDYQDKPKLDESLQIKLSNNPNIEGIYFIENESFEWVEQVYYPHLVQSEPSYNWIFSDYVINCFSANFKLKESITRGFLDDDEIYNIEVYDFESAGLYPKSQKLDLLVKEYLKNVEPDWGIQFSSKDSIVMDKNRVYHFFEYHFESYKGDCYDFINHCTILTNEVWEVKSSQNLKKLKYFDKWKTEKVVEYNLDSSKLKLKQKNKIETPFIQDLEEFDIQEKPYDDYPFYPLIELVEVKEKPYWTYDNIAYKFQKIEKKMSTISIGRLSVNTGNSWIRFNTIEDNLCIGRSEEISIPDVKNQKTFNRFAIKCFSANYQIRYQNESIEESIGNGWIEDFEIFDFEKYNLYPDPQQLEYAVQYYLSFYLSNKLSNMFLGIEKTISSFFDFHFNNYQGDKKEFIKNCIKVRKPLWKEHKLNNIQKRETFALWLEKICKEYDWDSKELEKDTTSKITNVKDDSELDNNMELSTIRELNALSPESYYDRDLGLVPSPLYLNLNNRLESSKDVYYIILKLNEIIKKYWGESKDFGDIKRKNIFNEWLNNIIEEHNLDRSKLGLEPIATLEPTQPIKKDILEIELVKESNSIDDTLIIIPLIELVETNVPVFWSYYNYAQIYKRHATRYIENGTIYYRHNENRIGGSIESLEIKYLKSLKLNIVESFPYDCDNSVELINTGNGYLIGFFSTQHEIRKTQVGDITYYDGNISERIDKIQIQDFERQNLCPNPEHLDLVVKYYLKIIEPTNKSNGQLSTENYIRDFFNFHLNSYFGTVEEFVKHAIKITKEVWEIKNVPNRNREIYFNFWLDETIKIYKLDRSELGLEPVTTPEPPQAQNDLEICTLTLSSRHGAKTAIYHTFKQLIDKNIIANSPIEVARFLIQNVKGFESSNPKDLATEIGRERDRITINGKTEPKNTNKVDLEGF